jgi:hypothetical protein
MIGPLSDISVYDLHGAVDPIPVATHPIPTAAAARFDPEMVSQQTRIAKSTVEYTLVCP